MEHGHQISMLKSPDMSPIERHFWFEWKNEIQILNVQQTNLEHFHGAILRPLKQISKAFFKNIVKFIARRIKGVLKEYMGSTTCSIVTTSLLAR